ncbi:MAG TPA: PspC domain-containing protein [Bacteroidota bacterium]
MAGLCGGLGEYLNFDPTVVRLFAVVLCFASGIFPFLFGYAIAWMIVPPAPHVSNEN